MQDKKVRNGRNINVEYLRERLKASGKKAADVSKEMGFAGNYLSVSFAEKRMNDTALRLLCSVIDADYGKAKEDRQATKPAADVTGGVTADELKELTELVVSYIQDVGKIQSDVVRELRELKTKQIEQEEKLNKTLHELDVFMRNEGAANRQFYKTVNNYLSGISTCMRIK